MGEYKIIDVEGLPIAKLKEKFLVLIIKDSNEFISLASNSALNKELICYQDDEKIYFYNDDACYLFFRRDGDGHG